MRQRGATLLELLVTIVVLALLASLLLPAIARAKYTATQRLRRVTAWHSMRIGAFLDDATPQSVLMWSATNEALPMLDITPLKP